MNIMKMDGTLYKSYYTNLPAGYKAQAVIDSFVNSGENVLHVQLEDGEYSSVTSAANTLRAAVKKLRKSSTIAVKTFNGKIFLVSTV